MLIERNLAPALILVGVALVLPGVMTTLRAGSPPPSIGGMITGNFLAAFGFFLAALLMADIEAKGVQMLALGLIGLAALGFGVGTLFTALRPSQETHWFLGGSGFVPLLGAGSGIWGALKR